MAVSASYLEFVLEQLGGVRRLVTRRMFGGVGVYSDGAFFAVLDNDTVFFKVDAVLAERHRARGMPPFAPIPGARPMMGYYQVPADVLEDADELVRWARGSIAVAVAAAAPQPRHKTLRRAKTAARRAPRTRRR